MNKKEDGRFWLIPAACGVGIVVVAGVHGSLSGWNLTQAIVGALLSGAGGWRAGRSWPRGDR